VTEIASRGQPVTLFFSDIEGSTGLVHRLGAEAYAAVLARHRRVLTQEIVSAGGEVVECRADEFFAAFAHPREAVAAAVAGQLALAAQKWPEDGSVRVRMGLNAGVPTVSEGVYLGLDVNRTARICSAGHGGQVLVSETVREALSVDAEFRDLGQYALPGLPRPERIFQLVTADGDGRFPPLRASAITDQRRRGLWRRRPDEPALGEIAWQVRSHLAEVPADIRSSIGHLGSRLSLANARSSERMGSSSGLITSGLENAWRNNVKWLRSCPPRSERPKPSRPRSRPSRMPLPRGRRLSTTRRKHPL
jgi:class 3 adenylate cyclase